MITANVPTFYIIRAVGEAAELITSVFSPGSMGDITDVTVLSKEFDNDIEPMNELDETLEAIKEGLGTPLVENVTFNPLFIPMHIDDLDDALDVEMKNDSVQFTGMDGNPFAIKTVAVKTGIDGDQELIAAAVAYQQFELPSYHDIMEKQANHRLN